LTLSQLMKPLAELDKISLFIQSGFEQAQIKGGNVAHATNHYPTVVADRCILTRGRWYFEVTMLTEPNMEIDVPLETNAFGYAVIHPEMSAEEQAKMMEGRKKMRRRGEVFVVGVVDKSFFGDAVGKQGLGDDHHSWGLGSDGYKKFEGNEYPFVDPDKWKLKETVGIAVDVDKRTLQFYFAGDAKNEVGYEEYEEPAVDEKEAEKTTTTTTTTTSSKTAEDKKRRRRRRRKGEEIGSTQEKEIGIFWKRSCYFSRWRYSKRN